MSNQGYDGPLPPYYVQSSDPQTPNLGLTIAGMDPIVAYNFVLVDTAVGSGGGSSVKVNGSTVTNPNFNGTTPAAPGGNTNVTFQVSGSSVSGYVPTSGGTPGGSNKNIQFNNSGSFGGSNNLEWDNAANTFLVTSAALFALGAPVVDPTDTTTGFQFIYSGITPGNIWEILLPDADSSTAITAPAQAGKALSAFDASTGLFSFVSVGTGTVTSVALATGAGASDVLYTISGSPVTTSGTITETLRTQTANFVFAGPTSAGPTSPTFRALVAGDLPAGTGTVTSVTFTGDGTVLSSTPSSAVTTTGTLTATLANAAGGTVLGRNATTSGAPSYTIAPVLGIPGTSTGSIALASSTASGKYTITAPANAATPTLTLPTGTGTFAVTASSPIVLNATTGNLTAPTAVTSAASLTSNSLVIGAGSQATQVLAGFITDGTSILTVGAASTGTGTLALKGTTSGTVNLSTTATGANFTMDAGLAFSGASGAATTISTTTTNANLILTPNGTGNVTVPAGTLAGTAGQGVFFSGQSVGWAASSGVISQQATSGTHASYRFYNGTTLEGSIGTSATAITLDSQTTNTQVVIVGVISTSTTIAAVQLGQEGGGSQTFTATSGNQIGVQMGLGSTSGTGGLRFAPTSGTATFQACKVNYQINQTGGANGTVTDLLLSGTETALVGTHNALDIGTAGSGGNFTVTAAGVATKYAAGTLVSQGIPSEIVTVDLTAQTAAIAATNLTASAPRTGMYRVSWSAGITTAGTSSVLGGTAGFQVGYTSPTDSVAKLTVSGTSVTSAANTTATATGNAIVIYAKTGTAITYQYDYTSTGTAMAYELHIKLETL